jgi:ubiquinone/menaquinone biosynthesis C-methylase UbiE
MAERAMPRQAGHAGLWSSKNYGRIAPYYDRIFRFLFPNDIMVKQAVVEGMRPGRVLDIACGTGTLLELASRAGMECFGMDLSSGMLSQARAKLPDAELKHGSFYSIPWQDGHFEYVVETNSVSALGVDHRAVAIEMLRVCGQGGEIRIGDFCRAENRNPLTWSIERFGKLTGDCCPDYRGIFAGLGYETAETPLSTFGMYRLVVVRKG